MGKYYKRETVIYKFKHEMLAKDEYRDLSLSQRKKLWEAFLLSLKIIKKVSNHQAKVWKYPEELT
jgi:hypothetical protein